MEADRVDYIFDANVIMSILISGKSYHREVLATINCCSIDFVYEEISTYERVIMAKAKLSGKDLVQFVFNVFRAITIVPSFIINDNDWQDAVELCKGIDAKDSAYVALSRATGFPLITRDKQLYTGLRKKGFRDVILFEEFLASL